MRAPRGAWLGLAATVASAILLLAPVLPAPTTRILGTFQSEAATHAPALAAALGGLLRHGPFVLAEHPLHPETVTGAMYEPITTLVMAPFFGLAGGGTAGFALAWNAWHLVVLVGSALGAWIGARAWLGERDPEGWGAGLAAGLAAAAFFVHLSPGVGRTEAQNYPLWGLHVGLLLRAARSGRGWGWAALAVVPTVWAGGYATVFFAVAEPLVAAWALSLAADRRTAARGLFGVAVAAALAAAPLVWALRAHPYVGTTEARLASPSAPLAVLAGVSENLLRELPGYEVGPFVGWVTLFAAFAAVFRVRAAAVPLAIGLFLYWTSAGPAPTVGATALWSPAALFAALPGPFEVVRGWTRIVAFVAPVLALAAAALPGNRPWIAVVGSALALGEVARHRVGDWWTLDEPAAVVEARAAGEAPILLPLDGIARARRWLAPAPTPDVWAAMPGHPLFVYFQETLPNEPELFRKTTAGPAGTYDPCALLADAVSLRDAGFRRLYLRDAFLPKDGQGLAVRALKAVFGAPKEDNLWVLPERVPDTCAGGGAPAPLTFGTDRPGKTDGPLTPEERERVRAERRAERDRVRMERLEREKLRGDGVR